MENQDFCAQWTCALLEGLADERDTDRCRRLMRSCSAYHYRANGMDTVLAPYIGDLEGFIGFLTDTWGWKVTYDRAQNRIIADENKETCVCPVVHAWREQSIPRVICYCSEGFAELMFSRVCGHPVRARVLSSILAGDARCAYEIDLRE